MTKSKNLSLINKALICIIEMYDIDTIDEQLDCIEALRKLRSKLNKQTHKEKIK